MPLRPHAARPVFTNMSENVLSELASSLERAAMGTRFSESGALCLEAHVTGLVQLFSSGGVDDDDDDDHVNQPLLEHTKARTLLVRLRCMALLLSAHRPAEVMGILEEFELSLGGKLPFSADEVRAVLRLRIDGCAEADIAAMKIGE
jgi:hypothetical protein